MALEHVPHAVDGNGRYETQWNNLHRPCGLFMTGGKCPLCYVGELGPVIPVNRNFPNLGPRLSILDNDGKLLTRIGVAVDSNSDIYVGEVSQTQWPNYWPGDPAPRDPRCLRRLRKLQQRTSDQTRIRPDRGPRSFMSRLGNCQAAPTSL